MRSIKFPDMFNSNTTRVWKASEQNEATRQNTVLTLLCERGEVFGDPYFGVLLEKFRYEPNNYILRDRLIDMIYTQIAKMVPQLYIKRSDIQIIQSKEKGKVYCKFKALNQLDYSFNSYQISLISNQRSS